VAQLFDPQDHRADLAAVTRCALTSNGTPAGQAAALLLIAWLGSRLDWGEPQRLGEASWSLVRGAREVQVDIDAAGASGELVSRIEIVCAHGTYLAELARPEEIVATAQRDTMPAARTVIDRPPRTPQRDWLDELTSGGADAPVYARAVELVQRLVAAAV
jgi:glucose-6-phosphate dehydrogenase assembly protein OpcA